MRKELISISNDLGGRGLVKEADDLDKVLKSVLEMIDNKSIDIKQTEEGDEFVFDLFIDNKGDVVGAEPASGDLGSTCIMNEEGSEDTAEGSEEEEPATDRDTYSTLHMPTANQKKYVRRSGHGEELHENCDC